MLNPRAIAVQGIGYSPLLVAAQGLLPITTDVGAGGFGRYARPMSAPSNAAMIEQENDEFILMVAGVVASRFRRILN